VLLAIAIVLAFLVLPSPLGLLMVAVAAVVEVGEVVAWKRWLSRYRIRTGAEGLIGMPVVIVEPVDPTGRARVRGELWNVRSSTPLAVGAAARVRRVDGLVLDLEPAPDGPAGPPAAGG
jgi:membrane protein implicated in regulation of membrane protease activity